MSASGPDPSTFVEPKREILAIFDLNKWVFSTAYYDYMKFLHTLNDSVRGVKTTVDIRIEGVIMKLVDMLETILGYMKEFPPEDMGTQRYGNKSYRRWHDKLSKEADALIAAVLPSEYAGAVVELKPYLLDSFGNATRIDYGTGHEASFLIFLLCLFKLKVLETDHRRAVVLRIFALYLRLCRRLQTVYRMEPAGSRGVHALDDFTFVPFIFGSSQLIGERRLVPDSYTNQQTVQMHAHTNLFFDAIQYIFETKTGPFYEHSNQLWNISAVPTWERVNEGMFKMYEAEVLRKFPVVQHIVFGSLFSVERREGAPDEPEWRQDQSPTTVRPHMPHGLPNPDPMIGMR